MFFKKTNLLGSHTERSKEAMMTVSHQIENINRNINYFLKEPNENSGVASIINEMEDLLVGLTQHLFCVDSRLKDRQMIRTSEKGGTPLSTQIYGNGSTRR